MPHPFLSEEWVAAARRIREEAGAGSGRGPAVAVRMNLVITGVPFGEPTIEALVDSSGEAFDVGRGHLDRPDVTATLDHDTARALLVDSDPQAGLQAFMAGKIKLQGDLTKAMALQSDGTPAELTDRIRAITE